MNRQPRALLTVLLLSATLATLWFAWRGMRTPAPAPPAAPVTTPIRGGTLTSSLRSEPRSFNRIAQRAFATDLYATLTQGKLVRINRATQELEPSLAERWVASADGRTFTLSLRPGVTWSDGAPFTAADVAFSFQAAYDPRAASDLASALSVNGQPLAISTPDPHTVVVTLPAPFGPGLRLLDNLTIAPRHKLQPSLDDGTFAHAWTAATPPGDLVSIGPFQLSRYEPGQRLVFDRNPRYWKKDADGQALPYLDHLVLEIVPDQDAELVRLQSGAIDMLQQQLRPDDIATLQASHADSIRLVELGVSTDPDALVFNLRPAHWAHDPRGTFLPRREFRQAISHAVDREAFANAVYLGAAVPIWGPVTPGNTAWFSPNVPRYPFDLDKARALLAGLGLSNRDADDWWEDEKGVEARFTLVTQRGNTALERSASVLREALRGIGIAVDVVPLEQGALIERMLKGDFDAIFLNYSATSLDPALSTDFWLSSGSAHVWNIGQATPATDWEGQIDQLMAQQSAAVDQAERKRLFDEVQRVLAEQVPALYFVAPRLYMGARARVGHLTPSVLRPQLLWNAESITVEPAGHP